MESHFLTDSNQEPMTQAPKFRLTPDARTDLIEIRRFTVLRWGTLQSGDYLSKLRQAMVLLASSPQIGTQRPELGPGVSSFPLASHVVYYLMDKKDAVIFAVLHKAMVPSRHLEGRKPL